MGYCLSISAYNRRRKFDCCGGHTMKKHILCGFECIFSKKEDVWQFFDQPTDIGTRFYFSVVDSIVFGKGGFFDGRLHIAPIIAPSYFQTMIQQSFMSEILVLHLYPQNASPCRIDTYEDYLNSPCEMIILLYDCCYLEIYCKNQSWLRTMIDKAKEIPDVTFAEKYEDTDPRSVMYV